MGLDLSFRTRLTRVISASALLIYAFGLWVNRFYNFGDFRVLHLGGKLFGEGDAEIAYDPEAFAAIARSRTEMAPSYRELDVFISTPPFGWVMSSFGQLPTTTALVLWTGLGVLAMFGALRILDMPRWAALLALLLPFGLMNLHLGQTGFFTLLLAAGIHRLCVDDRKVLAGLLAGLVILKPTLFAGIGIWWLIDWKRWYPALLASVPSALALSVPSLVGGVGMWRSFLDALQALRDLEGQVITKSPNIQESLARITSDDFAYHPLVLILLLPLFGLMLWGLNRRWSADAELMSGAAIFASVLVSPHILIYDTGLILIPLAIAIRRGVSHSTLEGLGALYIITALMTIMSTGPLETLNDWTVPLALSMGAIAIAWANLIDGSSAPTATLSEIRGRTDEPYIEAA
jgi:hypothetical protein